MATLLYLQLIGLSFSFTVHILLLLNYSLPCDLISIAIQVPMVALALIRIKVTKPLRQGKDWYWDKSLKDFLPRWLKTTAILIFMYTGASCIYFLKNFVSRISIEMTKEDAIIAKSNFFIGLFAIITLCFAMESLMAYLYRAKKIKLEKAKVENILAQYR